MFHNNLKIGETPLWKYLKQHMKEIPRAHFKLTEAEVWRWSSHLLQPSIHIFSSGVLSILYLVSPGALRQTKKGETREDMYYQSTQVSSWRDPHQFFGCKGAEIFLFFPEDTGVRADDTFLPHRDGQLEIMQLWIFTFQSLDYIIKKIIPFTIFKNNCYGPVASQVTI